MSIQEVVVFMEEQRAHSVFSSMSQKSPSERETKSGPEDVALSQRIIAAC
jgi:hypothetical protein